MEYRLLGNSTLNVSVIGFGAWGIGGAPFWQDEGEANSKAAIQAAYDTGITLFDTAPVYGFGYSETLIGSTLKPYRDKVIIATKCGLVWNEPALAAIRRNCRRASILQEVEDSLRRLQTDYIDLYQVHWPDDQTAQAETLETLLDIQAQGKIRFFGVSNYNLTQLQKALKRAPITSLQSPYNLLQRSLEQELIPFCRQRQIGVLAYSPLASGVLTGKYGRATQFTDWRSRSSHGDFRGARYQQNIDRVARLKTVAAGVGRTIAQTAINWVIRQPGITSALVGAKNAEQVRGNAQAVGWTLSAAADEQVSAIFPTSVTDPD